MTTAGLDRVLTALSTELSFGASAGQMLEQHGHEVDRTLVERRTYAVARDAVTYLSERRSTRKNKVMDAVGVREGTAQVLVQVDAGAVPVGQLERPARDGTDPTQELTPVRKLPKGRRPKAKREVRVALAWQPGNVDDTVVDVHVAPHRHPEFTGDRMYCAALEAGMGDNTHVHGTFDMARWQVLPFEEQFGAQPHYSVCADFFHAVEYIAGAAKACQPDPQQVSSWIAVQARRLKEGQRLSIPADLRMHECDAGRCPRTDKDECAVVAARRYLTRNGKYMHYPRFIAEGLPIGSGEVEGCIWDDFWQWQDERDKKGFRLRLLGVGLNRFRGPCKPRLVTEGAESLDLTDLSPMFAGAAMARAANNISRRWCPSAPSPRLV